MGDGPAVRADDYLLRRVHPSEVYRPPEGGTSRPFASSFKSPHRGELLSVYVLRLLEAAGLDAGALLIGNEAFSVVGVPMSSLRDLGLDVQLDPDTADTVAARGEAHALVVGAITKSCQNTLAKSCDRVIWQPSAGDGRAGAP